MRGIMAILDIKQLGAFRRHCEQLQIKAEKESLKYHGLVLACERIEDFMSEPAAVTKLQEGG